jgi:hypothetical protein
MELSHQNVYYIYKAACFFVTVAYFVFSMLLEETQ